MIKKQGLQNSLKRCEASGSFPEVFYEIFLEKDEEIRELFKNTDFSKQTKLLLTSVKVLIDEQFDDDHRTQTMLENIAYTHDRNHYNISPEHYDLWLDSLCETIKRLDPEYSEELEDKWRRHMNDPINFIVAGY